ncbi:hypothetical protein GCM10022419_131570 [Nonomuraea rosea]|uniref:Uncharacterized protein n=1 Tax=Nonomuraea rosea TaxID=638574 RepID=A0ABP7A2G3_9ACTN
MGRLRLTCIGPPDGDRSAGVSPLPATDRLVAAQGPRQACQAGQVRKPLGLSTGTSYNHIPDLKEMHAAALT